MGQLYAEAGNLVRKGRKASLRKRAVQAGYILTRAGWIKADAPDSQHNEPTSLRTLIKRL